MQRLIAQQPYGDARRRLPRRPRAPYIQRLACDVGGCRAAFDQHIARLDADCGNRFRQRLRYLMPDCQAVVCAAPLG